MITIGVDAHKRVNEAVLIDTDGAEVGRWRGANDAAGWQQLHAYSVSFGDKRRFGIEGAGALGRGLAQHLVALGEEIYDINPRWTAMVRRRARRTDKSDRLDARAVATFLRQEASDLPMVQLEDETAALDILSREREAAVAEGVRLQNQLHALLSQLDPHYGLILRALKRSATLQQLKQYEAPANAGPGQQARAASVRRLAARLDLAVAQAEELAQQIRALAAPRFAPLTELCGINLLTAGTLAGILGPGRRFETDAELARYAGAAPIETSSAERVRHRLNRGGDRRLNAILYRIVLTQAHYSEAAKAYLARRMSQGRTRKEAVRALKRYIVRAIFRLWDQCCTQNGIAAAAPRATCGCT